MTLGFSGVSVIVGALVAIKGLWGLLRPAHFKTALRQFPRSIAAGYFFIALATAWFLHNLSQESVSDFVAMKKMMYISFILIAVATCIYVRDFLAVRGVALVLILAAKTIVDTARWVDSDWRLVLVVLAYVWVVAGMWFTISPWRLRDLIFWRTETDQRLKISSGISLLFGILLVVLGLAVF